MTQSLLDGLQSDYQHCLELNQQYITTIEEQNLTYYNRKRDKDRDQLEVELAIEILKNEEKE